MWTDDESTQIRNANDNYSSACEVITTTLDQKTCASKPCAGVIHWEVGGTSATCGNVDPESWDFSLCIELCALEFRVNHLFLYEHNSYAICYETYTFKVLHCRLNQRSYFDSLRFTPAVLSLVLNNIHFFGFRETMGHRVDWTRGSSSAPQLWV